MAELPKRALEFVNRVSGYSCKFILGTEQRPFSGGECVIFALEANAGRFAVRVEQHISSSTRTKVEREVQLLEAIKKEHIPRLPSLVGFELESTPPFIATSWADGHTLRWSDSSPPRHIRKDILKRIAEVTLDLLRIQEPGGSALHWITGKIVRTRINPSIQGQLPGISVEECEALQLRISEFHLPNLDDAPHVLIHGDMNPSNIIVNDQQVECVLDLGAATLVPLQFSPTYPRFLTNEPRAVGDTFDWSHCAYSPVQKEDRSFYLQCIADMASTRGEHARFYSEILARDDEEERHWWLSAISRRDMMRALKTRPLSFTASR